MVNEAYLNRLNAGFTPGCSAKREVAEVDSPDPFGFRIDHQGADRERDTVGNSAFLGVQAEQPRLSGQGIGQRPLPELQQQQRQGAADQRGPDQIIDEMTEPEPQRYPSRNL